MVDVEPKQLLSSPLSPTLFLSSAQARRKKVPGWTLRGIVAVTVFVSLAPGERDGTWWFPIKCLLWRRLLGRPVSEYGGYVAVAGTRGGATAAADPFMLPWLSSEARSVYAREAGMTTARSVRRFARCLVPMFLIVSAVGQAGAAEESAASDQVKAAWAALASGGHVALIRHGNAPPGYGGDPPGFKIDDCSTQRNLDEIGRNEARALGEAFRRHGVRVDQVQSSPWCRCLETARLIAVGPVETSWTLAPGDNPRFPARVHDLRKLVSSWRGPGTLVLVAHAMTVRPLVGILPEQAETVVLQPAPATEMGVRIIGRIPRPN